MEKKTGIGLALFAGGTLFGTAGLKILGSREAKAAYSQVVAAALRGKDCVMGFADKVQMGAADIYQEAQVINAIREEEEYDDYMDMEWEDSEADEADKTGDEI